MSIIWEAHLPFVSMDEWTDAHVHNGFTDECDLGYRRDLGGTFMEGVQRAVRMTCTKDACQRIHQVMTTFLLFVTRTAGHTEGRWKRCIGGAMSPAIMQRVWPEYFKTCVERQVNPEGGGNLMLAGEGKLDGNTASQSPRVDPRERSDENGSEDMLNTSRSPPSSRLVSWSK